MQRVLVANRGEIALRILRTLADLGIESVLAVSDVDREATPATIADRVICIGPAPPAQSYLNVGALISAATICGAQAVHPGYGFLAENAGFAAACAEAGLRFIGPRPELLALFGDKVRAREAAARAGVPMTPASPPLADVDQAGREAARIGYPVVLKAVAGGGGRGMRVAPDQAALRARFPLASGEAQAAFGNGTLYLERWIPRARHVEVQVAGDGTGAVVHFGDRDCSMQRRHQKLIEEAPAPALPAALRERVLRSAVDLCARVAYDSIGTVEFLVDAAADRYYFLEVNARVQVEHGVTELVTGTDLVAQQIAIADGAGLGVRQSDIAVTGAAIECRINAEDPAADFRPSPGRLTRWRPPAGPGIRVDSHCFEGYRVPPYYDSLVAKVMTHGTDRESARTRMVDALADLDVDGIQTTAGLARWLVDRDEFRRVEHFTRWLDEGGLAQAQLAKGAR